MRKKTVIISGIGNTLNNGCWAMAHATMSLLKKQYPDISFIYIYNFFSKDKERLKREDTTFIYSPWTRIRVPKVRFIYSYICALLILLNIILYRSFKLSLFYRKFSRYIFSADLLIDLSGDSISTDYKDYSVFFQMLLPLKMLLLNKPYCFYAQSIGPFRKGMLYAIVKFVIRKSAIVTARERITYNYLMTHGIKGNVFLTGDSAFLLEAARGGYLQDIIHEIGVNKNTEYIGISISSLIIKYVSEKGSAKNYINVMAKLCDHIVENYNFELIFIPHVMIPGNDDRVISNLVKDAMKYKNKVIIVETEYNASELKGIIGYCYAFIALRMHAAIAAVSQNIPTVVFAYNHKTYGIFDDMLGMKDLIIDIRDLSKEDFLKDVLSKIDYLIKNLGQIKGYLEIVIPSIKEKAMENMALCEKYLK